MNIYSKLTLSFLAVTLVPTILLALLTTTIIGSSKKSDAQESINSNLKAAWMQYYARPYQIQYGMLQASTEEHIQKAIMLNDAAFLSTQLKKWKKYRPYVDLWAVVDSKGRVIASYNNYKPGSPLTLKGLVNRALERKSSVISTEAVTYQHLKNAGLAEEAFVPLITAPSENDMTGAASDVKESEEGMRDGLVIFVVTPVMDNRGRTTGAIITGDLLNNDTYVPDSLEESIPGSLVTISIGGVQVSTNLMSERGQRAIGHIVSREVLDAINTNMGFRGEAYVVDKYYIAAYDPIIDHDGKVIGSLSVGLPKERFVKLQYENIKAIISIALIGIFTATGLGSIITYRMARPIKSLTSKAQLVSTGNLNVHTSSLAAGNDEIAELSRAFAIMVDSLRENQKSIRLSQEKLATQKNLIESIINSLPYCLYVIERNMSIVVWNRHSARACPICNSSEDCRNHNFMDHLPNEELKEGLKEVIQSVFSTGVPCQIEQVLPRGGDRPKDIYLRTTIFPILSEKRGPVDYIVWMADDITENKEMEASVISSEKLAAVGQLAAGVAHEVNNPLGGILNCLYNFQNKKLTEARKSEYLEFMEDGIKRVQNIVRQLLDFSQQHEPELVLTDLNEMIRGLVPLLHHMIKGKNIRLVTGLDEGLPSILVDKHQVEQVLVNLILNAIQAVDGEGTIDVSTRFDGGWYCINVSDDGVGIPSESIQKIFDPFFTTKGVGKGTGLGLSVSRGIIERHSGRIEVESEAGKGTVFKVSLPMVT